MIEMVLEKWHKFMRGQLPGGLDELLHDDVVFLSPVVFTPQEGKEITKLYLQAAAGTLNEPAAKSGTDVTASDADTKQKGAFRYVKEVASGNHAVLEFETTIDGKYVNGIDFITCDDDGKIIEFKVMIRPLQAINAIHRAMGQMLEQMTAK